MNKKLALSIINRDGMTCSYCGKETVLGNSGPLGTIVEHMKKCRSENPAHLCISCRRCNSKKNNNSVYEYLSKIEDEICRIEELKKTRSMVLSAIQKMEIRSNDL